MASGVSGRERRERTPTRAAWGTSRKARRLKDWLAPAETFPMIPYYRVPDLHIPFPFGWTLMGSVHLTLHAFGLLVAIGVLIGHWQALKYASRHGASPDRLAHMIGPMLITGFICAHLA